MTTGRQPLELIELDLPHCTRTFGVAPCTASLSATTPAKCYNCRATCADPANYSAGVLTVRFGPNITGLPKGQTVFPALKSVSSRPAEINLSGIDPNKNAMGKRARVSITLQDFAGDNDTLFDPYQAQRVSGAAMFSGVGHNPAERGTALGKMLARYPYYVGLPIRHLRGYVGDDLGDMERAHYVWSETTGPNAGGGVTITAKDIFDLVENKKSTCPIASRGKLSAAITIGATTATLKPAAIGDEYPASGRVCIGREVATFTRVGDVLTFTARGVDGTAAAAHAVNDVVQVCARFEDMRACDIISQILLGGGVPSGNIYLSAWQAEEDSWLGGMRFTATIPKPVGRATLIGEICQHGVMAWPDVPGGAIRFRANRPLAPGESFFPVTDAANIIQGSPSIDRADDLRASAIWLFHGMIDPTDTAVDGKNYDKLAIATVDENLYGQEAIKTIYSRWFGRIGDDTAAGVIAERLLARYRNTPKVIGLTLDIKDRAGVDLGSLLSVTSYLAQDKDGAQEAVTMQVNMIEISGDRIKVEAETYSITGRFGFWLQDPLPDYSTATDEEKQVGAFWMDDTVGSFPDGTGPYVYF